MKTKTPKFTRQSSHRKKRLGTSWRKPRGIDSKQKKGKKAKGAKPRIGYGTTKKEEELLVRNLGDIQNADRPVRIASSVGKKKKMEILKIAEEKKIKVLNG